MDNNTLLDRLVSAWFLVKLAISILLGTGKIHKIEVEDLEEYG